jgi:hypothetical protein
VATSDTCVEPGRWTVGDYLAIRKRSYGRGGPTFWEVFNRDNDLVVRRGSLDEVRQWVAEQPS